MTEALATGTLCLIDTDVWSDALHLEFRDCGLQVVWWGNEWVLVSRKQSWLPKVPPPSHHRRRADWLALPTLGKLMSAGIIVPHLSDAIEIELDTTPHSDTHDFFGFHIGDAAKVDTGLRAAAFKHTIRDLRRPTKADAERVIAEVTDDRFTALVSIMGAAHLWDIIHIWTAERFEIPFLLSMDRRFANQYGNERRRHQSGVQIISPSELIARLDMNPSSEAEVVRIRDIFRQQRLRPMCQFHWPKIWRRRLWMIFRNQIEFKPLHGQLEIPNQAELVSALVALEFPALETT